MDGGGTKLAGGGHMGTGTVSTAQCIGTLRSLCVEKPSFWDKMTMSPSSRNSASWPVLATTLNAKDQPRVTLSLR